MFPALAPTTPSWRRAGVIAGLGIVGVLSLLASTVLPPEAASQTGLPEPALRVLVLIQPLALVIGAAILGDRLTRTTWLQAPFLSRSGNVPLRGAVTDALIGALVVGGVLVAYTWFTTEVAPVTLVPGTSLSLVTAVLYGGLTEEVLMRWGLMSLVVWLLVKVARRRNTEAPSTGIIVTAIGVSALVFAVLHLPALIALGNAGGAVIAAAMTANVLAGLVFGALFARRGIESAMMAHGGAHVVGGALSALFLTAS